MDLYIHSMGRTFRGQIEKPNACWVLQNLLFHPSLHQVPLNQDRPRFKFYFLCLQGSIGQVLNPFYASIFSRVKYGIITHFENLLWRLMR
jgi:hypothetical protein